MKTRLFIVGVLALVCAAFILWQRSLANPLRYTVQGIDISHHQGDIDWTQLRTADLGFAYIKASEGGDWQDPNFAQNWHGAGRIGLKRGAYHYFSFCRPPELQARNFLAALDGKTAAMPAALDLEYGGACGAPVDKAAMLANVQVWIDAVEAATGKPVMIYTTRDFHKAYLDGKLSDQPFWLRSIGRPPRYKSRPDWTVWQWHHAARLPGIKGPVDRNVFRGSEAEFQGFLGEVSRPIGH